MIFEKSCGAIVYTVENGVIKYLLVEENSGFHSFPKGHLENEETEEQTAIREIKEETDLEVELITDFKVCEQIQSCGKAGLYKTSCIFFGSLFRCKTPSDKT